MSAGRRRERRPDRLFFVAAEGERTEYDYVAFLNNEFGAEHRFRIDGPRLSIRRNGLKPSEVVDQAIKAAGTGDFDGVWAVFDRGRVEFTEDRDVVTRGEKPRVGCAAEGRRRWAELMPVSALSR